MITGIQRRALFCSQIIPVAPFFVEQETPQLANAPQAGPLVVHLRDAHLQYAITWFGLAGGLAGVYLVWLRGRLRRA